MNGFECQRPFESQLLQKREREVHPQTPGAFEFDIHSYVNPCSEKMGVHEHYFHTRYRNTDNFVGQPHLVRALEEGQKSGAPSAKMTKHADLGLKMLFRTNSSTRMRTLFFINSCTLLKRVKKWCAQCRNDSTCWSRAGKAVLDKLGYFIENH